MLVSDFTYELPEERIAKFPPEVRGTTRLLVLDRHTGSITDSKYADLADFLNPGDVLILNDTRVMHARLFAELPDGRRRELVVLENHNHGIHRVMHRGRLHRRDVLSVSNPNDPTMKPYIIKVKQVFDGGFADILSGLPLTELAERYGTVPLPPYLRREATEEDKQRYQTVWAKNIGSAAAPTASLNMTPELLEKLQQKGVEIRYLTLHVGLGTFLPIRTDKIEDHRMHSEWFHIPEDTIEAIDRVKNAQKSADQSAYASSDGSAISPLLQANQSACKSSAKTPRVVALGTTVARTLEYYAKTGKTTGEDDIFIYPGFEFQCVDALLTNFHAPKSTVLMLASAFAGWDHLKNAYDHALAEQYNFLSYGDSMLIC